MRDVICPRCNGTGTLSGRTRPHCAKCGSLDRLLEWIPPNMVSDHGFPGECFQIRCGNCGYAWPEPIIDAKP